MEVYQCAGKLHQIQFPHQGVELGTLMQHPIVRTITRYKEGVGYANNEKTVVGVFCHDWPVSGLTKEDIKKHISEEKYANEQGYLVFVKRFSLNDLIELDSERMNEIVEECLPGYVNNITYRAVGIADNGDIMVEISCDPASIIKEMMAESEGMEG